MQVRMLKPFFSGLLGNMKTKRRIKEKILIIESDDWGAIRTPSKEVLEKFIANGCDLKNSIYKYDSLETSKDLEILFNVLNRYKGADGLPAQITANAIMANPDFQRIKDSNFHYSFSCVYFVFLFFLNRFEDHSQAQSEVGLRQLTINI